MQLDQNSLSAYYLIWIKIIYQRYTEVMTAPDLIAVCSYIANPLHADACSEMKLLLVGAWT
jgi:hypothetical protein